MLQFCVSQQYNNSGFSFRSTGITVYTFEEALYHVFHYWRESVDELLSEGMIAWVSELGLSYITARLKEISREKNFTLRIINFLQVIDYFSDSQLDSLKASLKKWEMRLEWEKLKERADYLVNRGEPAKAIALYKQALKLEENVTLLNNIGVAYMQLGENETALHHLTRGRTIEPQNFDLLLHYTEAAILSGQHKKARQALAKADTIAPNCADVSFLHGLGAYTQKDYVNALAYYQDAVRISPNTPYYIYQVANVYKTMRQYQKALEVLDMIEVKDSTYYVKEAEIHSAAGDTPAALRCMRKVTDSTGDGIVWAKLAEYYRKDYNWQMAEQAIDRALKLAPENDLVRLENARIKKGLGRIREYQHELAEVLKGIKEQYRVGLSH